MRDKIALLLLGWLTLQTASAPAATTIISVIAEVQTINGRTVRPSVEIEENKWGTIQLEGVGIKIRARSQGDSMVKTDYRLFLQNGKNRKEWQTKHLVTHWSKLTEAQIPDDKDSRVRHLAFTVTKVPLVQ